MKTKCEDAGGHRALLGAVGEIVCESRRRQVRVSRARAARSYPQNDDESVQYPTNQVVAILDTQVQTACAVDTLVQGGFLESEVELLCGSEEADRSRAEPAAEAFRIGLSGVPEASD